MSVFVCKKAFRQPTVVEGLNSKEEHPLSGTELLPPPVSLLQFYNTEERWKKKTIDIFIFA